MATPLSDRFWLRKLNAAERLLMLHFAAGRLPLYLVTEYPKSGGTWFAQMLADYLGIPFPRNRLPRFEASVMHGHYLHHPRFRNVFVVLRDGRDVMVSAYYHRLFQHELVGPRLIAENRRRMPFADYDDVRANLPRFIRYMFEDEAQRRNRFRWDGFVRSWRDRGAPLVRYEDLLADTAGTVAVALRQVLGVEPDHALLRDVAERYRFDRMAKRSAGQENTRSFLRKGIAGDWKDKFTREAGEVFDHYAGSTLIELGYESDRGWITAQPAA